MNNPNKKQFEEVINPIYSETFFADTQGIQKQSFDAKGILVLPEFVSKNTLKALAEEARLLKSRAYRSNTEYNVFVTAEDQTMPSDSPRNKTFSTSKGCIPDDRVPENSLLRTIYDSAVFKNFISKLQNIPSIFPYGDTLSSININYYDPGDSLEWHYDNSDFAITLLIQNCEEGGVYEYFPNMRYTKDGQEDYATLQKMLDGTLPPEKTYVSEGSLMIFKGNESLHRVTKVEKGERMLVTLNYNMLPNVPLSEKSRMTFFGRTQ